jgi:lysophospholipase L1-like esterase
VKPGSFPTSHAGAGLRHPRWVLFLAGCLATLLPVLHPRLQAQTPGRFDAEIAAFERSDRLSPPPPRPLLFTGSSSIRMWTGLAAAFPGQPVLNRGFGGSEMSDLLHYYERVIRPYNPSLLFVYEGDNDLASGLTPAAVAASCSNLVARLKQDLPDTHTVFLAVKPSPSRIGLLDAQRDLNARLRALADAEPSVSFVDVFSPMLDATGIPRPELYLSDRLHMTAAGYEVWRFVIQGFLDSRSIQPRRTILIDFGATATPTRLQSAPDDPLRTWNNLTATLGSTNGAVLSPLLTTLGTVSPFALHVDQRFNAANSSGTTVNKSYPARATLDSLFGNTEEFGGLANIQPVLRLSGLPVDVPFSLTFFASRMFASDNRETLYLVEGNISRSASLNASNNDSATASVADMLPDANGQIRIRILPGPGNNNANHFTYLGLLQLDWQDPPRRPRLTLQPAAHSSPTSLTLLVSDLPETAHRLESSPDLLFWSLEQALPAGPSEATVTVAIPTNAPSRFFRISP